MTRPLLLDLFCGAGGAAMGYHRAGFDVIGYDIVDQPNYPFEFVKADAISVMGSLVYSRRFMRTRWDAVHASPPCQRYSAMSKCRPGLGDSYPDLIGRTRKLLEEARLPYVIENVPGSPLRDPIMLCGHMFGLHLYRHRLFESSLPLVAPDHPAHVKPASKAGHWKPGTVISVAGNCAPIAVAREAMGIDWTNRSELAEAIPPAYTEYIGAQLLAAIKATA
jgi:DNA (cytosine-5)-methyltransferase 1